MRHPDRGRGGGREILVSSTTRALAEGGEVAFDDRGNQEPKGLAGVRQLYAVAG
jgi:hypothetical protein